MIGAAKRWAKRHWPRLSLRTYLFASFFLVAALPGVGAVALRVYENTLVRQTQAELVAQGAALAAAAAVLWPLGAEGRQVTKVGVEADPYSLLPDDTIDLSNAPIFAERPAPKPAPLPMGDSRTAATRLRPVLDATRRETLASIILLDRDGRIVDGTAVRGSYAALPEVAAALDGRASTVLRRNADYRAVYRFEWLSSAAALRVHHARPIIVDGRAVGVLLLSRSSRSLFVGLYQDWGKIAIGVLLILAALVLLSGILSRAIARPIDALRATSRSLAAGQGHVPPIPPTAAIEIQDLFRDFSAMAGAIEVRSHYLRDFAHAVSHEFKTPLAGIRGALELLQDHADTMLPEDRRRFLANADADASRLTLLVSRLLELARADMTVASEAEVADVVAVARTVASALRTRSTDIVIEADADTVLARAPAATLDAVLTTLVENSVQASANRVALRIKGGDEVTVTVTDDGSGIPEADRRRIFEPFFTSRRGRGGTGLGLPIAKSLIAGVGGTLVSLDSDQGAAFLVRVPGAGRAH